MSPVTLSRVSGGQGVASLASFKRNLGSGVVPGEYIEDLFSTYLYDGTGSAQTITNGIDLAGEGGMVWFKQRTSPSEFPAIVDTERGRTKVLYPSDTYAEFTTTSSSTHDLISFNSDGFTLGTPEDINANHLTKTNVSWTFRKAPGFFDVVTWTGNDVRNRAIPHSLGSTPGCIIVKSLSTREWYVWHRSANLAWTGGTTEGDNAGGNQTGALVLDKTNLFNTAWGLFTYVNDTAFGVYHNNSDLNSSPEQFVAYVFAHDAQIFGENADQSVIKCGTYAGNGTGTGPAINLGWEPQWIMVKRVTDVDGGVGPWYIQDAMRNGDVTSNVTNAIQVDDSAAETATAPNLGVTATGFQPKSSSSYINSATSTYVYVAIRRGPMKTPTDATKVFTPSISVGGFPSFVAGFPVDFNINGDRSTGDNFYAVSRLTGQSWMKTNTTAPEATSTGFRWDSQTGCISGWPPYIGWSFRRAPGFFDAVVWTGTGSDQNVSHNLGVIPEMVITKMKDYSGSSTTYGGDRWYVYHKDLGGSGVSAYDSILGLNQTASQTSSSGGGIFSSTPTSTNLPFSNPSYDSLAVTGSASVYVGYLFASCPGVSKVGSYTGTGSTLNVDCGFTSGARFVLIKRADTAITGQTPPTGYNTNWYVWDTARGIVAGNDPYLTLNTTDAEDTGTDFIDPYSAGFTVTSSAPAALNASGGTYIFLAIA